MPDPKGATSRPARRLGRWARGVAKTPGIFAIALSLVACGASTNSNSTTGSTLGASATPKAPPAQKSRSRAKQQKAAKQTGTPRAGSTTRHSTTKSHSPSTTHSTTPTTTTPQATTTPRKPTRARPLYTRPIHATLVGQNHTPTVNKNWTYSISVTDAKGHKLGGTETTEYAFNGSVVGTEKPENVPFKNGYYHDTIQFPARAIGIPLDVQVVVQTSIGSVTLDWPIKVQK